MLNAHTTNAAGPTTISGWQRRCFCFCILDAVVRRVGVLDIPSFGPTSIADRQAGPMVLRFVKKLQYDMALVYSKRR